MISKKHWSPGGEVSVQSVERSVSGGWIVSGSLTPNGICPDCGFHSRRRHCWRRRRLQDYPAHGNGVTVDLAFCRWRCLAPACLRWTFSDQIASIARCTSRVGEIVSHLGHATALAGCSGRGVETVEEAPRLVVSCPDPESRRMLTDGATLRDLAVSRQEAIRGWRQCSDAVRISQE